MPRRRVIAKREILPDPKYHNQTVAKFINHVMVSGKKAVAERIVYGALTRIEERDNPDPVEIFEKAVVNELVEKAINPRVAKPCVPISDQAQMGPALGAHHVKSKGLSRVRQGMNTLYSFKADQQRAFGVNEGCKMFVAQRL